MMLEGKVQAIGGIEPNNRLVIDVGMNDGSDTAYYLHCGCRVIAIEANPQLTAAANLRFAQEIAEGMLTVLNLGIAPSEGVADFYVASNHQWSSFSKEVASRRGMEIVETVRVPCVPLSNILRQYGVPEYIKIDIEGYDLFCLESLSKDTTPPYVSVEFAHGMEHRLLHRLLELGYVRFKLLNQVTYTDKRPIFANELGARVGRKLYRMRALQQLIRRVLPRADFDTFTSQFDWTFAEGGSGPFGEQTYGRWNTSEEVLRRHATLSKAYTKAGVAFWWDLHARKQP
jgi:FkbM family methyltransferase